MHRWGVGPTALDHLTQQPSRHYDPVSVNLPYQRSIDVHDGVDVHAWIDILCMHVSPPSLLGPLKVSRSLNR